MAGGVATPDHGGHQTRLNVDIRALRKDGLEEGVTWRGPQYQHGRTRKLIDL